MCTQELILHRSVKKAVVVSRLVLIYAEVSQLLLKDCQIYDGMKMEQIIKA